MQLDSSLELSADGPETGGLVISRRRRFNLVSGIAQQCESPVNCLLTIPLLPDLLSYFISFLAVPSLKAHPSLNFRYCNLHDTNDSSFRFVLPSSYTGWPKEVNHIGNLKQIVL